MRLSCLDMNVERLSEDLSSWLAGSLIFTKMFSQVTYSDR